MRLAAVRVFAVSATTAAIKPFATALRSTSHCPPGGAGVKGLNPDFGPLHRAVNSTNKDRRFWTQVFLATRNSSAPAHGAAFGYRH